MSKAAGGYNGPPVAAPVQLELWLTAPSPGRDYARMVLRRRRFAQDAAVFFGLRPGDEVEIQWIYTDWEPYGGDPDRPPIRVFPMRVLSEPAPRHDFSGRGWTVELGPAPDTPARQRRYAQLYLRDERDAPRTPQGQIDFGRTGSPNTVVMVWRHGKDPQGPRVSGAWVHLAPR